ncbi:MAG: ParB/RepB/Spo0J family partition protein [Nitrososphaerota archaeon]
MKVIGVERIPLDRIKVPDWAKRTVIADHELEDLARSMETMGQIEPIIVRRMGDGGYELISGYRRLMALGKRGFSEAEAKMVECDDFEAIALSIEENLKRADEHPFDTARKIAYMHKELGLSVRRIGELIGRDPSWVDIMLKIDSMDPEAKKILAPRTKSYNILYEIASIRDPNGQRLAAEIFSKHDMGVREVRSLVKEIEEKGCEAVRREYEEILKRPEEGGGEELNTVKVFRRLNTSGEYKLCSEARKPMAPEAPQAREALGGHEAPSVSKRDGLEEVRECDICGERISRSQGRFRFICRDRHSSFHELFKLIKDHGYKKIEHVLDYLIIEAEDLAQRPPEEVAEILKRRRLIAEKTGGLDLYMLDQLLEEVEKREV